MAIQVTGSGLDGKTTPTTHDAEADDPGFVKWMAGIAGDYASYGQAMGYNAGAPLDVASLTKELGEGNQGVTLLKMYNEGLTGQQVHDAYYGYLGDIKPEEVTALSGKTPDQLDPKMQKAYQDGLISYQPPTAGEPGQTQDNPGGWTIAPPVTHTGSPGEKGDDPLYLQSLFNHSGQTGHDTGAFGFDPSRGFVTSPGNQNSGTNVFFDKMVPAAVKMGLSMMAGAGIGQGLAALDATAAGAGASEAVGISGAPAGTGASTSWSGLSPGFVAKIPSYAKTAYGIVNSATSGATNSPPDANSVAPDTVDTPAVPKLVHSAFGNFGGFGNFSDPQKATNSLLAGLGYGG